MCLADQFDRCSSLPYFGDVSGVIGIGALGPLGYCGQRSLVKGSRRIDLYSGCSNSPFSFLTSSAVMMDCAVRIFSLPLELTTKLMSLNSVGSSSSAMRVHALLSYWKNTYGGLGRPHLLYDRHKFGAVTMYGVSLRICSASSSKLARPMSSPYSLLNSMVVLVLGRVNVMVCSLIGDDCPISCAAPRNVANARQRSCSHRATALLLSNLDHQSRINLHLRSCSPPKSETGRLSCIAATAHVGRSCRAPFERVSELPGIRVRLNICHSSPLSYLRFRIRLPHIAQADQHLLNLLMQARQHL
jgi:hypothetical protein